MPEYGSRFDESEFSDSPQAVTFAPPSQSAADKRAWTLKRLAEQRSSAGQNPPAEPREPYLQSLFGPNPLHDIDQRLEVANYYRALLLQDLFSNYDPAAQLVQKEVRDFIHVRLEELMGIKSERQKDLSLTEDEIAVLKIVAKQAAGFVKTPPKKAPVEEVQPPKVKPLENAPRPPEVRPAGPIRKAQTEMPPVEVKPMPTVVAQEPPKPRRPRPTKTAQEIADEASALAAQQSHFNARNSEVSDIITVSGRDVNG